MAAFCGPHSAGRSLQAAFCRLQPAVSRMRTGFHMFMQETRQKIVNEPLKWAAHNMI